MNDGVKILLARMETHPDEFIAPLNTGASKWGHLIESYMDSLDTEDQQAIKEGYKKIHQQRFTEAVMEELLDPHEDKQLTLNLAAINSINSMSNTQTQLLPSSNEPLVNRKPITKFGRLYNHEHIND